MTLTDRRLAALLVAALVGAAVVAGGAGAAAAQEADDEAEFVIDDVETNDPITAGEELVTTVEVRNAGNASGETAVWFYLGDHHKDQTTIQLDAGETATVELSYVSKRGDDGEWEHTTGTDDDTSERTVTIEEAGSSSSGSSGSSSSTSRTWTSSDDDEDGEAVFEIANVTSNDPIEEREHLNVSVTVENTGDAEADKRVWALIDGERIVAQTVTLEAGETATIDGSFETELGHAEFSNLTVGTPDDTVERTVEIEALQSDFVVTDVDAPWSIDGGETVEVEVEVTNEGDRNDTDSVRLSLDGTTVDAQALELDPGESETVTLTYESAASAAGNWDLAVETSDDSRTMNLIVSEPTEPTPTPDDGADAAAAATATPTEEGSLADADGFGAAVALLAVLGAALLARRRP